MPHLHESSVSDPRCRCKAAAPDSPIQLRVGPDLREPSDVLLLKVGALRVQEVKVGLLRPYGSDGVVVVGFPYVRIRWPPSLGHDDPLAGRALAEEVE